MIERFYADRGTLGSNKVLDLSGVEFERLKKAKKSLGIGLDFENRFDLIVKSYKEFEKFLFSMALNSLVDNHHDYPNLQEYFNEANLKISTILTSVRLYFDQSSKALRSLSDLSDYDAKFQELKRDQYDQNLEYRFAEQLRNHVQHKGMPVSTIKGEIEPPILNKSLLFHYSPTLMANKTQFELDENFKKSVMEGFGSRIDLKSVVRIYVSCIIKIHNDLGNQIQQEMIESRKVFDDFIGRYEDFNDGVTLGLQVFHCKGDETLDQFSIITDWDDVRSALHNRSKSLKSLKNQYIYSGFSKDFY